MTNGPEGDATNTHARTNYIEAYPGLTPGRLATLACLLTRGEHKDALGVINQAIEIWNRANEACCDTDERKLKFQEWHQRASVKEGRVSFEDLAQEGFVPKQRGEGTITTANGIKKVIVAFYEAAEAACKTAFKNRHVTPAEVIQIRKKLSDQRRSSLKTGRFPYAAVGALREFQNQRRSEKSVELTAIEIAQLLGTSAPPYFQLDAL